MNKKITKITIGKVNKRSIGDEISNKCYNGIPIKNRKCHIDTKDKTKQAL
jgi:hypothetical protein